MRSRCEGTTGARRRVALLTGVLVAVLALSGVAVPAAADARESRGSPAAPTSFGASPPTGLAPDTSPAAAFHSLTPTRVLDTRNGTGLAAGPVIAGAPRDLTIGGAASIPATASAVVMNTTVTGGTAGSFVSVWPAGKPQPTSSNLNFAPGQTIANLVTAPLGTGGKVSIANAVGAVHVVGDVVGYFDDGTGAGDLFTGIAPFRILDSRTPTGGWLQPLVAGQQMDLKVSGPLSAGAVPLDATSVVINVTVTGGTAGSFVSVWPGDGPVPQASTVNFAPGQTIPNLAMVRLAGGSISFANAVGAVDVVVDVVGYFAPSSGSRFHALTPVRVLDDRVANGLVGPWGPGQTRDLPVTGANGIPAGATGMIANVTATQGTTGSFITVFPTGVTRPSASNLNFAPGETIPNLVVVKIGASGSVSFFNQLGSVDIVADAVGYFAPS